MKWFDKTIEIYDGNWCSHYVCPFGMVCCYASFPTLVAAVIDTSLILFGASIVLFIVGSFIGRRV